MCAMVRADAFATQARIGDYIGIPYEDLDCQAFVERVLKDCGIRRNWKGSNHMWREAVHDREPIASANLVPGMWLFTVTNDGGEKARGYNDDMGNAKHVGIYLGTSDPTYIHSTTGGVQWGNNMKRWTHAAKANDLIYPGEQTMNSGSDLVEMLRRAYAIADELSRLVDDMKGMV